jgi:hypothetical protein
MSITNILIEMPSWYLIMLIVFSLYYSIRGIMEQTFINANSPLSWLQKFLIFYVQEFLFKFIITVSGFLALFIANHIFLSLKSINDIGAGTAILLIFMIIWGITGISGYLTFLIVSGKFPAIK